MDDAERLPAVGAWLSGPYDTQIDVTVDLYITRKIDIGGVIIVLVRTADEVIRPLESLINKNLEPFPFRPAVVHAYRPDRSRVCAGESLEFLCLHRVDIVPERGVEFGLV